jgi:dihydroorotate dehydrogenase electron transfer subunit
MPANRTVPLIAREALDGPYVLLSFRHPEVASTAKAGQFVMIKAGLSAEPPLRRPFSIMSVDPQDASFTLFVKRVGTVTRALFDLREGALAQCLGPLGSPFTPPCQGTEALLVAGGYGIAPFLLFSNELRASGVAARLFYGGRSAEDLQLLARFAPLGVGVAAATEDGSLGHRGLVTDPLEAYLDARPGPCQLYACGPEPMLRAVARIASSRGLQAQVSLDPWMGCGIGTCLGCVVKIRMPGQPRASYRCACTEGPVFDAATVAWPDEAAALATGGSV